MQALVNLAQLSSLQRIILIYNGTLTKWQIYRVFSQQQPIMMLTEKFSARYYLTLSFR